MEGAFSHRLLASLPSKLGIFLLQTGLHKLIKENAGLETRRLFFALKTQISEETGYSGVMNFFRGEGCFLFI